MVTEYTQVFQYQIKKTRVKHIKHGLLILILSTIAHFWEPASPSLWQHWEPVGNFITNENSNKAYK